MKLRAIGTRYGATSVPGKAVQSKTVRKSPYNHAWRQHRLRFLADNPLCVMCGSLANVVDHIQPHNGDMHLFWDVANHQALCADCHNSTKQKQENSDRYGGGY